MFESYKFKNTSHKNFLNALTLIFDSDKKHNKTSIEKLGGSFGITDQNTIKELVELYLVEKSRRISNHKVLRLKRKYNAIVDLYKTQVNLSHRTSQSMLLNQYSTPATISFLAGRYCETHKQGLFYEASAGNGMLTIANSGKDFVVNEIDDTRNNNLSSQNIYKRVTKKDSSQATEKSKQFDAVITNPPFGRLKDSADWHKVSGFVFKELDHKMSVIALDTMKDDGRAAIIIGGHTKYDVKGRVQAGKNRVYLSYLYHHYNVEDIINIDGKKLYSKMGTGFNTRLILINGRKSNPSGYAPTKDVANTDVVSTHEELYNRVSQHFGNGQGLKAPYVPAATSCFNLDVHTPDSMSFEIHNAIKSIKNAVGGSLNDYLVSKLKYKSNTELCKALAAEQIDGVSTAIYNIEKGEGLIIGDQTGIGKGRQAAAVIRYAYKNGLTPIFLTEKANLFTDLYRDLEDINSSDIKPFIVNTRSSKTNIKDKTGKVLYKAPAPAEQKKIISSGKLPKNYDCVVATYSQFASSKPTEKQFFLNKVSKGAILIMDESHNASGTSATGGFLKEVVKQTKGCLFLSATFAKRPDNMPIYALKTSMKDANLSDEALTDAIVSGGVALQEVLASQLVAEGQMIRRQRTYEGIEVDYLTLDKQAKSHEIISDKITSIIREIIAFQEINIEPVIEKLDSEYVKENKSAGITKGTAKAGVDSSPYFSKVFNVVNQMLFAIKAEQVANHAIKRLKQGYKPVIAFANTMESFLDDAKSGDIVNVDFKEVLKRGLDGVMRYTVTDMANNKTKRQIYPHQLNSEAQNSYYDILNKIDEASTGIVASPIDLIVKKINEAGFTTAEVTGRSREVELMYDDDGTITGKVSTRKKEIVDQAFRKFNENEIDVLLINQSGSTGASAHAVTTNKVKQKDVKQRVMIVLQAELDINTEVQKRGRINRTGQVLMPKYDYISSAIPAEKRLQMMLQKKLKSLDANTTSNQKNSEDLMKSDDFLNKYGNEIVEMWLTENMDINLKLGNVLESSGDNLAHKTSGRVAILSVKEQKDFYNEVLTNYKKYLSKLIEDGDYDLEVETVNLDAKTIDKNIAVVGKKQNSSFGGTTFIEKCEVNNLRKPFKIDEINLQIAEALNGKTATQHQEKMLADYLEYTDFKVSENYTTKSVKWDNKIKAIKTEKAYIEADDKSEYYNTRLNDLSDSKAKDIKQSEEKILNQSNSIVRLLKHFNIGKVCYYPTLDHDTGKSNTPIICTNISFSEKAKNPFAPSNISFSFAFSNSVKKRTFEPTNKYYQELQSIIGASYFLNEYKEKDIIKDWDDSIKRSSSDRKIAYIVTGNILQGYGKYNKGKLISYTLKGGGEKKGILIPIELAKAKGSQDSVNVPIYKAKEYVVTGSDSAIIKTNTELYILRSGGQFKVYVPSSKKQGGIYFLDEDLLKLTDTQNFNKIGTTMLARVSNDNIDEFLKILENKHSISALVPRTRLDEIKGIKNAIKETPPAPTNAKDKKLKLVKVRARARQRQLKLINIL